MEYTYIIFLIGVITIVYASLSTLRTIDIKELIAYSSVSHAAVYLLGVFSNSIQGIEGAITLGLAHGFVSPGLFICAGGVLYDRSHTRVISFYRGVTQVMPLFAILFFILCLANCGAPLTLNFIGEFLSLYGVFERSSLYGVFASSSIIFSAAYTIYMFQRIAFGGSYSRMFTVVMPDLTKREFTVLMLLTVPTVALGIYPASILDGLGYGVSLILYGSDSIGSVVEFSISPNSGGLTDNQRSSALDAKVDTFAERAQTVPSTTEIQEACGGDLSKINELVASEKQKLISESDAVHEEISQLRDSTSSSSIKEECEGYRSLLQDHVTVALNCIDEGANGAIESLNSLLPFIIMGELPVLSLISILVKFYLDTRCVLDSYLKN
jgi:Proton-conducting membrane transporter